MPDALSGAYLKFAGTMDATSSPVRNAGHWKALPRGNPPSRSRTGPSEPKDHDLDEKQGGQSDLPCRERGPSLAQEEGRPSRAAAATQHSTFRSDTFSKKTSARRESGELSLLWLQAEVTAQTHEQDAEHCAAARLSKNVGTLARSDSGQHWATCELAGGSSQRRQTRL